jgi:hypothetical protein
MSSDRLEGGVGADGTRHHPTFDPAVVFASEDLESACRKIRQLFSRGHLQSITCV